MLIFEPQEKFEIDYVICDIDVRYYVDCSFSKDNGQTWEKDFEDDDETDEYVKSQLPCMKERTFTHKSIWSNTEKIMKRTDWCPVIDVNEGKVLDWPKDFILDTHFKVCDQGLYLYSNADESRQILSEDCDLYYVPDWLDADGDGYGDYLQIRINGDGTIEHWDRLKMKLFEYAKNYLLQDKIKSNLKIEDYVQ